MKRRFGVIAVALALASACTATPPPEEPVAALAEVEIPGAPPALTHGDDPLPPKPPGLAAQTAPEADWPCLGTGTDGRRVQLLYVTGPAGGNIESLRSTFEVWARQIEGMFLLSGRDSGGERLLRFVTQTGGLSCNLSILDVRVSENALRSFDQMILELRQQGLTDQNRSYHAWVESNAYCGIGLIYSDDRPTGNFNDANAMYARSDRPCWNANTAAHEIIHNLGGVQNSAPNSTGGLHSRDEADVMSYPDGAPRGQMVQVCPPVNEDRFDCRKDDYFAAVPAPGSYLASHWNVANSASLSRPAVPPTTALPPPTTTSTTLPATTTTSVGQGKTKTELTGPTRFSNGVPFTVTARVTGDCGPSGVVEFVIAGRPSKVMSRQVLVDGDASVTLTIQTTAARPTIRAEFVGDQRCAASDDDLRPRLR